MERLLALVVDSVPDRHPSLQRVLEEAGLEVVAARQASAAFEVLRHRPVAILLAQGDLIRDADRLRPGVVPVVLEDAPGERGREAILAGAFDVLAPSATDEEIRLLAQRALRQHELLGEVARLRQDATAESSVRRLVGWSLATGQLRATLRRLASSDASVAFVGEEGTGRELAARALHAASRRAAGEFVVARGASLSPASLTGPGGLLERGAGGTLLVAEPAELPLETQEALSRAAAGPRLVAKSRDFLQRAVEEGSLVGSLHGRLTEEEVRIAPLRERPDDIAPIARQFIDEIRRLNRLPGIRLTPESLGILERHHWPGNVRELIEVMERAAILAAEGRIEPRHLPERLRGGPERHRDTASSPVRFREAKRRIVDSFERGYLADLMDRNAGNVTTAAGQAGMLRSALQRLLRKHELRSSDFRGRRPPEIDS